MKENQNPKKKNEIEENKDIVNFDKSNIEQNEISINLKGENNQSCLKKISQKSSFTVEKILPNLSSSNELKKNLSSKSLMNQVKNF